MLGITNLQAFVFATLFVVLIPGVNTLFVLAVSAKQGKKHALFGLLGVLTGDASLMLVAVLGGQTLINYYPQFFLVIKILGAAYLAWLGFNLCYQGIKHWDKMLKYTLKKEEKKTSYKGVYIKSCIISLSNPKAILFFATFFLQFIDPSYPYKAVPFFFQALIVQLISCTHLLILIFLGTSIFSRVKNKARWQSVLQIVIGAVFCAYSLGFLIQAI